MASEQPTAPEARILNFNWNRTLAGNAKPAFWAGFMGWALDAFDFMIFPLALTAITAAFALSQAAAGFIITVTLVGSGA